MMTVIVSVVAFVIGGLVGFTIGAMVAIAAEADRLTRKVDKED